LASLNDDDREVVIMRCWDGLAVTDIAAVLDCTPNAVSVRLHKARRRLIDRLDGTDSVIGGHVSVDPQPRTEDRHGRQ
jgi:RNA polymerase sigma-70 factor (ECF subfamily)